ncbi:hypothetical protein [Bradyrhizobium sp. Ash2021]|nr:hypothetical protein [Bradyrhizobium sp. Ash2021]WMT79558.1 hypothetical protein NL528_44775 [Bradyrhizobium sp. Ash2021]
MTFWLCTGRRFAEQISLAACGFTLRAAGLLTAEQRAYLSGSGFDAQA